MKQLHPNLQAQAQATTRTNPDSLVSVFDIHGTWHFVSAAHTRLLGYQREELLGHNYTEIVVPLDLSHARLATADAELTGETTPVTAQIRHKNGDLITVKGVGRLVIDPDTGEHFFLSVSTIMPD
jgi:PAS domain S-box-containing protein